MTILDLLLDGFWSAIAAMGFGVLFNVPRPVLYACGICGAVGHASRELMVAIGFALPTSTLIGASLIGFIAIGFAKYHKTPSSVFATTGSIPMVPGVFAFRTMVYLLRIPDATDGDVLLLAASNGVMTGLILAAIAIGIASPRLVFIRVRPIV